MVVVACRLTARLAFLVGVDPCTDVRWGAVGDGTAGGSAFSRACVAGVSESAAISSATVSAVGEADDGAAAVARGTSTKSAVSDRGEWRGGEVERRAEEERDQTISSSSSLSERESLAHLVLEVSESMSREDAREVVIVAMQAVGWTEKECVRGTGGNGKKRTYYLFDWARGRKGVQCLSDPPIYQAVSIPRDRNLLNIDASSPDSPLHVPHDRRPLLLQHDLISPVFAS